MRRVYILIIIILSLFINGCSGEKNKIENVVTLYNNVLIDAYLRPDPMLMELFVTKPQLVRIDSYISLLLKKNRIMRAEIKSLHFKRIEIKDNTAEAYTDEAWTYSYLDSKTRKPISPDYQVRYSNVYYLRQVDGRWVVDMIDAKEIEGTEKKDKEEIERLHRRLFEEMKKG